MTIQNLKYVKKGSWIELPEEDGSLVWVKLIKRQFTYTENGIKYQFKWKDTCHLTTEQLDGTIKVYEYYYINRKIVVE